ncbi:SRPBCC domain-containing protein [Paenibacillus sp. SYP-B3998]|uniref:SRPBCC domain-containing protein n=1 Tax=Paenibacillus sp. SYP-B3998 TaxID=2678564 RepID=A0A6G4A3Q3_9BACL|nr:SRPBCC family protein [Paenibacillus sp. SYP-B3998]NEW08564.1 SRPBCC domain-containing protein [Paenibacillus sp. SYP-B3998]
MTIKFNKERFEIMSNMLSIDKQREIVAAAETVWNVLIDPDFIKQWLGVTIKTDWKIGHPISFSFSWDGKVFEDKGHLLELEAPKVFSYDYWSGLSGTDDTPENYSIIKFTLLNQDNKTILKLKHSNFCTWTMYEHSDKNWEETLDSIKKIAERESIIN